MTEQKYPALELPSAGFHGNGSRIGTYYKIEARNNSAMPKVIDPNGAFPLVLDNSWRTVPIVRGAQQWGVNIPVKQWDADAADHDLVPYVVAEAHRWAFLAALEAHLGGAGGCCASRRDWWRLNSTRAITPRRSASRQFRIGATAGGRRYMAGRRGHQMNEDDPDTVSRTSRRNASNRMLMPRVWI